MCDEMKYNKTKSAHVKTNKQKKTYNLQHYEQKKQLQLSD